jgi:hypothetical protein
MQKALQGSLDAGAVIRTQRRQPTVTPITPPSDALAERQTGHPISLSPDPSPPGGCADIDPIIGSIEGIVGKEVRDAIGINPLPPLDELDGAVQRPAGMWVGEVVVVLRVERAVRLV